jgi:hypothetical protein
MPSGEVNAAVIIDERRSCNRGVDTKQVKTTDGEQSEIGIKKGRCPREQRKVK